MLAPEACTRPLRSRMGSDSPVQKYRAYLRRTYRECPAALRVAERWSSVGRDLQPLARRCFFRCGAAAAPPSPSPWPSSSSPPLLLEVLLLSFCLLSVCFFFFSVLLLLGCWLFLAARSVSDCNAVTRSCWSVACPKPGGRKYVTLRCNRFSSNNQVVA